MAIFPATGLISLLQIMQMKADDLWKHQVESNLLFLLARFDVVRVTTCRDCLNQVILFSLGAPKNNI